jgi:hypothetical protein
MLPVYPVPAAGNGERVVERSRLLASILLAGSLLLSLLFWLWGIPFFFAFLLIPVIPFLSRKRTARRCPVCGWETTGSEHFCPFDATPLAGPEREFGQ